MCVCVRARSCVYSGPRHHSLFFLVIRATFWLRVSVLGLSNTQLCGELIPRWRGERRFSHLSSLQLGCSVGIYELLSRPNSPRSRADKPGSQAPHLPAPDPSRSERNNPVPERGGHRLPNAPLTCRRRHSYGLLETPDNLAGLEAISASLSPRPQLQSRLPSPASFDSSARASAARVLQIRDSSLSPAAWDSETFPSSASGHQPAPNSRWATSSQFWEPRGKRAGG